VIDCHGSLFDFPDFQLALLKKGVNEEGSFCFLCLSGSGERSFTLLEKREETPGLGKCQSFFLLFFLDLLEMFKSRKSFFGTHFFSIAPTGVFLSLKTQFIRRVVSEVRAVFFGVSGSDARGAARLPPCGDDLPHLPDSWR